MTDNIILHEHLSVIVKLKRKEAELLAKATGRSVLSCLGTLIRPHIGYVLDPSTEPSEGDARERDWRIKFETWDVSGGNHGGFAIAESEENVVSGLDSVVDEIVDYMKKLYEKRDFCPVDKINKFNTTSLKKRLHGLRPTISRSGGYGRTTIRYVVDDKIFVMVINICRAELELDRTN